MQSTDTSTKKDENGRNRARPGDRPMSARKYADKFGVGEDRFTAEGV